MSCSAIKTPPRRRRNRRTSQRAILYAAESLERRFLLSAAIPAAGSLINNFTVAGQSFGITSLTMEMDALFANDSALSATLTSPAGTTVQLFQNPAAEQNLLSTVFDDSAPESLAQVASPSFAGSFKPQQPFTAFAGQNPNGQWKLTITNNSPTLSGTLLDWSVTPLDQDPSTQAYVISKGQTSSSIHNGTDFGSANNSVTRQYTITNTGSGLLVEGANNTPSYEIGPNVPVTSGNGPFEAATSTLNVSSLTRALSDLTINAIVFTDFQNYSNLTLDLRSPQGTDITLLNNLSGLLDDPHSLVTTTTFDDSAATSIVTAAQDALSFSGTYRPENPLSALNGQNPNGTWSLSITDDDPNDDTAAIDDWSINFAGTPNAAAIVSGANASNFIVIQQPAFPLAVGASTAFDVAFNPSVPGAASAQIALANIDPAGDSFVFPVEGNGSDLSKIAISGDREFDDSSFIFGQPIERDFTITNTGLAPLQVGTPFFEPEPDTVILDGFQPFPEPGAANAFVFEGLPQSNTLLPGQSFQLAVDYIGLSDPGNYFYIPLALFDRGFQPTPQCINQTPSFVATLVIPSNDPDNPATTLSLRFEFGNASGGTGNPNVGNANSAGNQDPALPFDVSQNGDELSDLQTVNLGYIPAGPGSDPTAFDFDNNGPDPLQFSLTPSSSGFSLSSQLLTAPLFSSIDFSVFPAINTLQTISGSVLLTVTDQTTGAVEGFTFYLSGQVVSPPTNFTTTSNTLFSTGQSNNFAVTATSFPAAALTVAAGALPHGVTFFDNGNGTGKLTGAPASGTTGLYTLTLSANNGAAPAATQTFSLAVTSIATFVWSGHGDGVTWNNAANWTGNTIPGQNNAAFIPPGLGTVQFPSGTFTLHALIAASPIQINAGATLSLLAPSALGSSLTIKTGGKIDLTAASLALDFGAGNPSPFAAVKTFLSTGSIFSSTVKSNPQDALGYADGSADIGTAAQAGQVLIKYTQNGDTNLDGLVNFADLVAVIQKFNKSGTDWSAGNFTFGTSTNFADLVTVVQNFNRKLTPPAAGSAIQSGGTTVPLTQSASVQPANPPAAPVTNPRSPAMPAPTPATNDPDADVLDCAVSPASILMS